jgi:hypothetical protein
MTIEDDFEAFREHGLSVQDDLNTAEEVSDQTLRDVYAELDPLLEAIVLGRRVVLSGNVSIPVYDDDQTVVGIGEATESVVGNSNGVYAVYHTDSCDGVELRSWVIGISLALGPIIIKNTIVERTRIEPFAFGPLSSVRFTIPDAEFEIVDQVSPEDDDPIAEEIDSCVFSTPVDFAKLRAIFEGTSDESLEEAERHEGFAEKGEIFIAFYLDYLNKVFDLSDFDIGLSTDSVLTIDNSGTLHELIIGGGTFDVNQKQSTGFRYLTERNLLCIGFTGLVERLEAFVPMSKITAITMCTRDDAVSNME